MKRLHAVVRGRVTGVCYRMFCQSEATALGLTGWVRNNADGSVELVAEGPEDKLETLLQACGVGPKLAEVRELRHEIGEPQGGHSGFVIRPDGSAAEARALQQRFPSE